VWRIVLDNRIPDGYADVMAHWDLDDVAHYIALARQLDGVEKRRAERMRSARG
jgi:hypothetical protein